MIPSGRHRMTIRATLQRTFAVFVTVALMTSCSNAGTGGGQAAQTVNLAVIVPLSGSNASVGEQSVNAAKMAVEDINKAGGIKALGGAQINLITADSTNDPQGAVTTTERVLSQNNVAGVFGLDLSPLCTAALPVFIRHKTPFVGACIADTLVTPDNGGYYFQIAPKGSAFGAQQVKFLQFLNEKYGMGLAKVAILYVDNPYGQSTEKGIETIATSAGLQIVLKSGYPADITDASPLVTKLQQSGAQVLFPVSYISDAELIMTALNNAQSHILIVGGGAGFIWPPIGDALGSKVNGLTSTASWNLNSKNITSNSTLTDVTKRYRERYKTFMPEQAGEAYAGIWALADAMEAAGSADPQKVRDALSKLDITSGGGSFMQPGEVKFGPNGENVKVSPVMIQWQNGVPVTVYPAELATADVRKP